MAAPDQSMRVTSELEVRAGALDVALRGAEPDTTPPGAIDCSSARQCRDRPGVLSGQVPACSLGCLQPQINTVRMR